MIDVENTDAEVLADLETVLKLAFAGERVDPVLAGRVRERSEVVQREISRQHGQMNVAVELVRETREEE